MNNDTLVRMANQIAEFFDAMPEREQALHDIADHLRKFWEPRMRRQLLDHLDRGGEGWSASLLEAVRAHRDALAPQP